MSGVDDFVDIELGTEDKIHWLRGSMTLQHGIPPHETIRRVFGLIAPDEFESAFRHSVGMVVPTSAGNTVVAIDRKTSRRSGGKGKTDAGPLHRIRAFPTGMGAVLGQTATAEMSNEITAIPELLAKLAIEDCVVTIDAMGTQTKIAGTIRDRGAHHVLCVTENHPDLHDSIPLANINPRDPLPPKSTHVTTIKDHGPIEIRRRRAYAAIDRIYKSKDWQDLASFPVVDRTRTGGDYTGTVRVFYISRPPADTEQIARPARSHWEIENPLHWYLDVQCNDHQSSLRSGYVANNLAIIRHIEMNPLRLNTTRNQSIKRKRMAAATINEFRTDLCGVLT